jgi:type IV pilus assembly protein PilO
MRLDFRRFLPERLPGGRRDPVGVWRIALAVLAVLNLIALAMVFFPPGGSAESLDRDLIALRLQLRTRQAAVQRLKTLVKKVEAARVEQEAFMQRYFIDFATASSTIESEILTMANTSGLKAREHSYSADPVEGSDTITMMTITANYEGSYADMVEFVNLIDRSDRFLIIDNIQATPQQTPGMLTARLRMNVFLRESPTSSRVPPAESRTSEHRARPVAAKLEAGQ